MANKIPLAVADFQTQLSASLAVAGTSFSLTSATDDDGNALPAGKYCFTVDNGKSTKEYLMGQLNGTTVTSVVRVSRQGVETSGAAYKHRIGAPVIVTDFATIQRVADVLRGQLELDGTNPIGYDTDIAGSLADRKDLATVGFVLDTAFGGALAFESQTVTANAGEVVAAGNLVYFKTSDQEWYLTDADTAATVNDVQLGIALGSGTDGAGITGGVLVNGIYTTTGLTAGSEYYVSNTGGAYSTSAGTTIRKIGLALSTTKLFLYNNVPLTSALSGGSDLGTPSSSNKFITEDYITSHKITRTVYDYVGSPHTWTKDSGLVMVKVELWGAGGSGGARNGTGIYVGGGGGGAYREKVFIASELDATETVTIGAGGTAVLATVSGNAGGNTTFGSLLTALGGSGGLSTGNGGNGGFVGPDGGAGGTGTTTGYGIFGGGGGGGADTNGGDAGGGSVYGGGGGGGVEYNGGAAGGGTSVYGGSGGSANQNSSATAGTVPGGGGGALAQNGGSYYSGAGANGRAIVTEYYL